MTIDLSHRFTWPTLLSVAIHGAVVAGLLYTSVHQVVELPAPAQPISVTMVSPAELEPAPTPAPPQPVLEPELIPKPPKEAPVVIEKPKPKPKPVVEQPRRETKPVETQQTNPFENIAPARPSASTTTSTATKLAPSVSAGPRALSRNQPQYPPRAQSLRIEGRVKVKFDVTADGRVENVQILSAQPANMFEREVKAAMRKWRYEGGKPDSGLIVNVVFRLNSGTSM